MAFLNQNKAVVTLSLTALAAALASVVSTSVASEAKTPYHGVVAASAYVPGSTTGNPTLKAGYYAGATVFMDLNGNGVLDTDEPSTTTDLEGRFTLVTQATGGQLVADVSVAATNTATNAQVPSHLILRASQDQIADQGVNKIVISPMSTEVQRMVEANGTHYADEKAKLAARLTGPAFSLGNAAISGDVAVGDFNKVHGAAEQYALLYEANALTNRYTYATAKLDRGDKYPDALAVPGGDPRLATLPGVTQGETVPADTRQTITYAQAQQAAFNIEGIPAYDHLFIIMEENKSTDAIVGNTRAPAMNKLLSTYNQLATYYSTGNPSEPNYTALGGADDYGITDDNWFGCGSTGANAPTDVAFPGGVASDGQILPATGKLPPADSQHLAGFSNTAGAACSLTPTAGSTAVHNLPGDNLFTLLSKAGLTVRTYNESMNPGQDARGDSIADAAVKGTYVGTDVVGNNGTLTGTPDFAVVGGLYKVKHGPSMAFQSARNLPEFFADNRTIFGSQYDEAAWKKSTAYPGYDLNKWIYDQFSKDLAEGDVGNVNFIVPDQCDDMHGVGSDTSCANNNNGQTAGIVRADIYLNRVVTAIQNSPLWKNKQKRVAIVVMFDEGEGSSTSCCGWNAGGKGVAGNQTSPIQQNEDGTWSRMATPPKYNSGNAGHGNSIFGVITNQQDVGTAAKGIVDSDAYSHFSLVRTLQDMFQLADPAKDASYLNRAKYTEAFIASNILNLPEFASSSDTHFDSVRPINHAYVIPAGYAQRLNPADIKGVTDSNTGALVGVITPQTGPDKNQKNIWSLK
jgi:hypothetical protein